MLKPQSLVTLSKRIRSLLIYKVLVRRPVPSNSNERGCRENNDNEALWVKSVAPQFNALSSGHGSGF